MASRSDPKGRDERVGEAIALLERYYHFAVLLVVMGFMFWTRTLSWDHFLRDDGGFYLAGIDSYYHWRSTIYTIENWPNTMPYDVMTAFPTGQRVGQFGTAFDQLIATIALLIGLGNPSEELVHQVVLVSIPLMGALVAIPVYLIGKRLAGRLGGLGGIILLALFPGSFFARSSVGQHQHHVAEVLFMLIALYALMAALRVAEREKPVWEQVLDRDVRGLRPTIGYSALAGVALAAYIWVWPPGVLLIGIFGVFFLVYLVIEYFSGRSPEHLAFVGVIAMVVTGTLTWGQIEEISTSVTGFGYLATILALGVAAGCVFMGWLGREWDRRDLDRQLYGGAVAGSVVIALGLMWLLLPDVFNTILGNVQGRLTPIGAGITGETVQEARPPQNFSQHVFREFGLAFYTGIIGLIALFVAPFFGRRSGAEYALIIVWALFIISMNTAQVRFAYYLAPMVAILNAYAIGLVAEWADLSEGIDELKSIEGYQIMVLATVVMILIVPLMPPVASATVVDVGETQGPQQATLTWDESLEYLQDSTPIVGEWGNADNELIPYGTYERPPNDDFDYPEGAYGVMAWWDYGHLLTVKAERVPHSNPFQRNARSSAGFLLADSEERASLMLDAISTGATVQDMTNDELQAAVDARTDQEASEEFRYVMIDDATVSSKFGAITAWGNETQADYTELGTVQLEDGEEAELLQMNDRYDDTMAASLYFDDATGMEQYRLVHESSHQSIIASIAQQDQDGQWQTIAINQEINFGLFQQIQAQPGFQLYDIDQVAGVKTFERVEGATITGETDAEPGAVVRAAVRMNATATTEREFFYIQTTTVQEDGTFALTVPYATTEELGPEDGVTESTVVASDDYIVEVLDEDEPFPLEEGTVEVPEPAIYDGDSIEVELEEFEPPEDPDEENGDEESPDDNGEDENDTDETENGE